MPSLFAFDVAPCESREKVAGGGPSGSGAWLSHVRPGAASACARLAALVPDRVHVQFRRNTRCLQVFCQLNATGTIAFTYGRSTESREHAASTCQARATNTPST